MEPTRSRRPTEPDVRPDARTQAYYEAHAASYAAQTRALPMGPQQEHFLAALPGGARILDTGCGSGRDTAAFRARGFTVDAVDGSPALAAEAAAFLGTPVGVLRHQDVAMVQQYDAIWASATLLHVPRAELPDVFRRYQRALTPGGVMFCSFKMGEADGLDDAGRLFTRLTPESARDLLTAVPGLSLEHVAVTPDSTRNDTTWLGLTLRHRTVATP